MNENRPPTPESAPEPVPESAPESAPVIPALVTRSASGVGYGRSLPGQSADEMRTAMLLGAGFDERVLRAAVGDVERALGAEKQHAVMLEGGKRELVTVPDEDARAKARDQVFDLAGVYASRSKGQSTPAGPAVVINLPGWLADLSRPVPVPVEVIDATPRED